MGMVIDIRTLFFTGTVVILVNTLILLLVWYDSKAVKDIIQQFSFSLLMMAIGTVLIVLRGQIPDFWSIIVCNCCYAAAFFSLQEGVCRYLGRKSPLLLWMKIVFFLQILPIFYFTYIDPSFTARVQVYCLVSFFYCALTLGTIFSANEKKEPPLRLLSVILSIQLILTILRAVVENDYNNMFFGSAYASIIIMGHILIASALSLCFLWIALYHVSKKFQEQADFDALTHIASRGAMERFLENCIFSSIQGNTGILWMDIDDFKRINDVHGHPAGDAYLAAFSQILKDHQTENMMVFRYGGDEFILIARDIDKERMEEVCEKIRTAVQSLEISWSEHSVRATVSMGIAFHLPEMKDWQDFLKQADAMLYEAKMQGKNMICKNYSSSV